MNAITINEPELKAAAEKGSDEFLDVFSMPYSLVTAVK